MQIAVFGASGKVGRLVVDDALQRGYKVIAVVHRSNPFTKHDGLDVRPADINDRASVSAAIDGSTAVVSCLGSWGTKSKDIVSTGTVNITRSMREAGIARIVTMTGAGAHTAVDRPGIAERLNHALLGIVAGRILADGEKHLATLAESELDWTCIRSPIMTNAAREAYELTEAFLPPWATIPRRAVAQCLVDQLESKDYTGKAPFITRERR